MTYHITTAQAYALGVLALWELVWKGLALWKAGRRNEPGWFVAILILNTVGILPIIYLLITRDRQSD